MPCVLPAAAEEKLAFLQSTFLVVQWSVSEKTPAALEALEALVEACTSNEVEILLQHFREPNELLLTATGTDAVSSSTARVKSDCPLLGCCGESFVTAWRLREPGGQLESLVSALPCASRFSGARAEPGRPRWSVVCEVVFVGLTTALAQLCHHWCHARRSPHLPMDRSDDAHAALLARIASGNDEGLGHEPHFILTLVDSEMSLAALCCRSSPYLAVSLPSLLGALPRLRRAVLGPRLPR